MTPFAPQMPENTNKSACSHGVLPALAWRHGLAAGVLLAFLSACALLPPSLRRTEAQKPVPEPAQSVAAAAAARDEAAKGKAPPKPGEGKPGELFQLGSGTFLQMVPPPVPPPGPEEASLNFEGADVREVAKVILADYMKESYTIHPSVAGTVTFRTVKPIPMRDLLPTLETLLRQNNAAVVREDGLYKIIPVSAVRGSLSPTLGGRFIPIPQGFSVVVVPLQYVGAREMERLLAPFAQDNTVRVDEVRNLVILAGTQRELNHLVDAIRLFDVDFLAGYSVGLFPIKGADVKALVADLEKVFGPGAGNPLAGAVRIIPIDRMNALLVVTTNSKYLEMAGNWIDKLDQLGGASSGGSRFYVYQVRNGRAENLAQLVGDLFSSRRTTTTAPTLAPGQRPAEIRTPLPGAPQTQPQTTTTSVTPAPGAATFSLPGGVGVTTSEVRVIADKDTNSLLILATPSDYDVIESALKKLDVIRRQVLVEVLLAEVTLTDDLQFGIDWFITTRNNTSGTLNAGGGLGITRLPSAVPAFAGGLQLVNLSGGEVRAVLRALGEDGKTQILASPQIMVLDNEKAEIKVGDKISVQVTSQTGVATGTGVINSYQYLETGILLTVTPRINSGGLVTLEVNQEVSEKGSTPADNPNPDILTRSAKTSVVVASGESIVLAGLIRENKTATGKGLPLLSKIPILGAAFGSQTYSRTRTELVLLITPKIVNDVAQARQVTEELRLKLPALKGFLPPREPPKSAPEVLPVAPEPPKMEISP
jgi:general secretion pathway protein D